MTTKAPADREFEVRARGELRDRVVLANFREGLRKQNNPETGLPFTDEEIRRATQPKSRWYNEAQAIDDYDQLEQRKALFMADQVRPERASTKWLRDVHGALYGLTPLSATGGSGSVLVTGTAGTILLYSTTLGDATAYVARDPAGNTYQVIANATIGVGGTCTATLKAITPGASTNPDVGTVLTLTGALDAPVDVLTWTRRDPGMNATCTVTSEFRGGTDDETDAEYLSRLFGLIRYKEGAGNDPQIRAWGRQASNAIEDAFVYPCAFYAGSLMVAVTQKRGTATGPLARIPTADVIATAVQFLTPPNSPVLPTPPHVLVVPVNSSPTDVQMRLEMAAGSTSAGWTDARPFPSYHATAPAITVVTTQTDIRISCPADATLPGQVALATLSGANAPHLMVWNAATSRFVVLNVSSVQDLGGSVYRVILASAPGDLVLAVGQWVSPVATVNALIAETVEQYFDTLGPRELFDIATDPRGSRCIRHPSTSEEYPYRAGALLVTRVIDALGGASADGSLASMTLTEPPYPTSLLDGPNMLTLQKLAVYAL